MAYVPKRSLSRIREQEERALPAHVHRVISRGREYYYFQLNRSTGKAGLRVRIMNPWSETEIAEARILVGNRGSSPDWGICLRKVYATTKDRARVEQIEFGIDLAFLIALLNRQDHKCAVSGISFEVVGYDDCHMRPFAPSLDRVNTRAGYTKDNVRLVCRAANFAMGQWGLPTLERLAEGICAERRKRTSSERGL